MQRRQFLRLGALGLLSVPAAGWLLHSRGVTATANASTTMPAMGQPLRSLPRLINQANGAGFHHPLAVAPKGVELISGQQTELWLYNNLLTPLIEVTEGEEISIPVSNQLSQPTTVHWHGLMVPGDQDGGPHHAILPDSTLHYRFTVPEGNAGLHWFHPHPHDHTAEQIAHSLAGAFMVRPKTPELPDGIEEHLLMVTDLRLDDQAQVAPHTPADWMNGREGELLLVNGQYQPVLEADPGTTLRLRLINACAGRYLKLNLEGHALTLIGTDGGLIEQPETVDNYLLVPGQRCDLIVRINDEPDSRFELTSLPYDRDWMGPEPAHYRQPVQLLNLQTRQSAVRPAIPLPSTLRSLPVLGEASIVRHIELSEEMPGMAGMANNEHGGHGQHNAESSDPVTMMGKPPVRFLINGQQFSMDSPPMFEGQSGKVEEWIVKNLSHMDHPFHIHGTHFQVEAYRQEEGNWQPVQRRAWQDTVNLEPGQSLKLKLVFHNPGDWMFHCHIIEHEEMGMMASIRIS
ncbi:multicopper oxidase family protein [Nitrincola sp. MINF-07-Sa-05]|uniref:multicopper oxidase family protein n=1 Tax=Nitrincola salilacus TaxID=3400273 RepID=UPI00391827C4